MNSSNKYTSFGNNNSLLYPADIHAIFGSLGNVQSSQSLIKTVRPALTQSPWLKVSPEISMAMSKEQVKETLLKRTRRKATGIGEPRSTGLGSDSARNPEATNGTISASFR